MGQRKVLRAEGPGHPQRDQERSQVGGREMAQIEAVRVAQDAAYAASLTDADWYALAQDPTWQEMVSEQSEMVSSVLATHGHKLPGAGHESTPTAAPSAARVVGTDIARIQGLGIVTNLG